MRCDHCGKEHEYFDWDKAIECQRQAEDAKIAALREAISAWPVVPHWYDCGMFEKRGGFYLETECTCGVGAANAARAAARRAAGLED